MIKHLSTQLISCLFLIFVDSNSLCADSFDVILRKNMADLRSDKIKWNCSEAMDFLGQHVNRRDVQAAISSRLTTKDVQEKEAVLLLLMQAENFKPDENFIRMLLQRMKHWGRPKRMDDGPAGDAAANYLIGHAHKFGDLLASEITPQLKIDDNSLWFQYAIARALAKGGVIKRYALKYDAAFMTKLVKHLNDDEVPNNAQLAIMTFLFLGEIGVPTLQAATKSPDEQARVLSVMLLKYLSKHMTIRELGEQLAGHYGFDDDEGGNGDLDDCDLSRSVISPHYFRFKPGEEYQ